LSQLQESARGKVWPVAKEKPERVFAIENIAIGVNGASAGANFD
jgi:hypothetical protein